MSKKTIYVAIASQKGGGGKSTLSIILANKLYFEKGKRVCLIDCDNPQYTNANRRQDELKRLGMISKKKSTKTPLTEDEKLLWKYFEKSYNTHPHVKEEFSVEFAPKPTDSNDILKHIPNHIDKNQTDYDIVIYDMIGSLSNTSLLKIVEKMDYVFVPIETEEDALKSAIASLVTFASLHINENNVFGFFSKFKIAEKEQLKCMRNALSIAKTMQLPILLKADKSAFFVEDKACFRSPLVKSSLFPANYIKAFEKSEGNKALEEICKIITK